MLRKVISGGQNGADQAGLYVAKRFGLQTGGTIPLGYKTLDGKRPDLGREYGLVEHPSDSYVPRTYQNVQDSDGTVRLAGDFKSPGEICTIRAIMQHDKPHYNVDLTDLPSVNGFVDWVAENSIEILNVAGNSNNTFKDCGFLSRAFLTAAFFKMGLEMSVSAEDLLAALGLGSGVAVFTENQARIDKILFRMQELIEVI
jgi:hypothetical protein